MDPSFRPRIVCTHFDTVGLLLHYHFDGTINRSLSHAQHLADL